MGPSSRKHKASELNAIPNSDGHPTPMKNKSKSKETGKVSETAPAPEHRYTVDRRDDGPGISAIIRQGAEFRYDYSLCM